MTHRNIMIAIEEQKISLIQDKHIKCVFNIIYIKYKIILYIILYMYVCM